VEDFEDFIKKYGEKVEDEFWSIIGYGEGTSQILTDSHGIIRVDVSVDTTHGLEGWYSSEITGTVETTTEYYEFLIRDAFCCETVMEYFERDEDYEESAVTTPQYLPLSPIDSIWIEGKWTLDEHVHTQPIEWEVTKPCNNAQTIGENNMSNTTKNIGTLVLLDSDSNVPEEASIVAQFTDVVYVGTEQDLIHHILLNEDVQGLIDDHNEARSEMINQSILERNGVECYLQPIKFKDLDIRVKN